MSDFADLLSEGFDLMLDQVGVDLTCHGQTAQVVSGNAALQRELRATGTLEQGMQIVEIRRIDLDRLGIADRSIVETGGIRYKAMIFDTDAADPCIRLTLQPYHGSA